MDTSDGRDASLGIHILNNLKSKADSGEKNGFPRPRVLIWHWGRRGGGPRYTLELARVLAGHQELEIYLSLSRQCEILDSFRAIDVPRHEIDTYTSQSGFILRSLQLPQLRRQFARFLRATKIDLVFCTMDHLWNTAVTGCFRGMRIPYLLAVHDAVRHPGESGPLRDWLLRRDIAAADGVLTLTENVRNAVVGKYQFPLSRTWVAPHGVFTYGACGGKPRSAPQGRPLRLLFFGRILPYKGLELLLEAVRRLQETNYPVELEIWGAGDLSPYKAQLHGLHSVRLENRWIQEGEIEGILAQTDLCVLPYREASQSGVVPTAFASGMPVLVTPLPGLLEQVKHGQNALVAAGFTAEALAEQIRTFSIDRDLYHRLSIGAIKTAQTETSWSAVGGLVFTAIRGVLEAGPRPTNKG